MVLTSHNGTIIWTYRFHLLIYICICILYIFVMSVSMAVWCVLYVGVVGSVLVHPAFSLHRWLAPLFHGNAKRRAVHSLSICKPYAVALHGVTHQLGSLQPQAKLQGLGGGLDPRCAACRSTGVWKCLVLTNQTPLLWVTSPHASGEGSWANARRRTLCCNSYSFVVTTAVLARWATVE